MDNVQPGQTIGAYRIIHQIGQGGMATVYKAYHAAMDRYVALKVLPRQLAESTEFTGRFQQEARIIANLEHPHILPVHDYGEADGITYLVMRFMDAGTLKEKMQAGALPLNQVDRLFTQLADALDYAHTKGVIHRDLKPSNVLVDARGSVFLTDFGIAKLLESSSQFTGTGAMVGTPAYMSPEQAQGTKVDQRTDIYALGIILYEMVTGRVPFEAETPLAVILKHLNEPLPLPSVVKPDISPSIERILLKALAKNPEDRYATVGEFVTAWKGALSEVDTLRVAAPPVIISPTPGAETVSGPAPTVASPSPSEAPAQPRPAKRPRWMWIAAGVAGLCVVCVCAFAIIGPRLRQQALKVTQTAEALLIAQVSPGPETETAASAEATQPSAEEGPTPAPLPTAAPVPTAAPPSETVASWTGLNTVYGSTIYGDQIIAWGAGGLSFWSRADGTLLQTITRIEEWSLAPTYYVLADETNGGLWVATDNGVAFFDGTDWNFYTTDDGLDSNLVNTLAQTSGYVLAGTLYSGEAGGGLLFFDGENWEPIPDFPSGSFDENPDLLSYNVLVIGTRITPEGVTQLAVGTDNGIGLYDGETWRRYSTDDGLPHNQAWALMLDDDGTLWAGTENGAARFTGDGFEPLEESLGLSINGIVQDAEGRYWLAYDGGAVRYDAATDDADFFSYDTRDFPVYTLFRVLRDPDTGSLYFGSEGGGLIYTDLSGEFYPWVIPNLPRFDSFGQVSPAPDGSLWFVQEYGNAIDRYDPASDTWSAVELPCAYCVPLTFHEDGSWWLGGEEGLWFWPADGSDPTQISTDQGLPDPHVYSFAFAPDGHVLVGTPAGLAHIEGVEVTAIFNAENSGLASDNIRALYAASDGTVWVGTDGGLSRLLPDGNWEHYTVGNPFDEGFGWVHTIGASTDGALWFGTDNNGVWRLFEGAWKHVDAPSLLSGAAADAEGGIWFGSYYNGAWYFNGDDVDVFQGEDGLVHPNVNDAYVDPNTGEVWFATSGGVTRYRP